MYGVMFNNDVTIAVDSMPYRKKPCLVIIQGNTETKYATFNNEDSAREFMDILCNLINSVSGGER